MKRFSERKGLRQPSIEIQIAGMNDELRNSLWNVLHVYIWSSQHFLFREYGQPGIDPFSASLWFHFFKKPIDTRPDHSTPKLNAIRKYFFSCEWHDVYDFLEFVLQYYDQRSEVAQALNSILERELAGYRFIAGTAVDITDEQEVIMLEETLRDTRFEGVNLHLKRALELLTDKKNPDYRNSIKESISAVESIAKVINNDQNATLGDALKILQKDGKLHTALKNGFSSLYGYTSDEQGIRHAMLEEPASPRPMQNFSCCPAPRSSTI